MGNNLAKDEHQEEQQAEDENNNRLYQLAKQKEEKKEHMKKLISTGDLKSLKEIYAKKAFSFADKQLTEQKPCGLCQHLHGSWETDEGSVIESFLGVAIRSEQVDVLKWMLENGANILLPVGMEKFTVWYGSHPNDCSSEYFVIGALTAAILTKNVEIIGIVADAIGKSDVFGYNFDPEYVRLFFNYKPDAHEVLMKYLESKKKE